MKINYLNLISFRNYDVLNLEFNSQINIFIGKNAQGKTNILEAIYFLSTTKSFKTNQLKEIIRFDKEFSKLLIHIDTKEGKKTLELILSKYGKKGKINRLEIKKSSDFIGLMNVVLFTPDDLQLVKGNPKLRRKLIDIEISKMSKNYLYHLKQYNELLKERNIYLKKLKEQKKQADLYLEVLTEQLAKEQYVIINKRKLFINQLNDIASQVYNHISQDGQLLGLKYKSSMNVDSVEEIVSRYKELYQKDIYYAQTNEGIHKDDITIELDRKSANLFASQGQQRTIVLSMKIALLELIFKESGEYPILLLDDVLSELDQNRQTQLLDLIENKVQTFITTTSIEGIDHRLIKSSNKIYISNGKVIGENNGRQ